jgi:hypothetical protein
MRKKKPWIEQLMESVKMLEWENQRSSALRGYLKY